LITLEEDKERMNQYYTLAEERRGKIIELEKAVSAAKQQNQDKILDLKYEY
jgi:hypothetical protein